MQRKLLLLACFCICVGDIHSQQLPFINYTPADGLASNQVHAMYQDSRGRLYFLTYKGLSVYDGARFTNYGPDEGLANEIVNDVMEITPDSILVATNTRQLNCLIKGKINPLKTADGFYPVINRFYKSRSGTIYVAADDGLFTWKDQKFNRLPLLFNEKKSVEFLVQIQEIGGLLLMLINPEISEEAGDLLLYNPAKQKILAVEKTFITYCTDISTEGDIWISTNKGIRILKKETLLQGAIRDENVPVAFASIQNKKASFLKFDNLGQLWISIYGDGLFLIKPGAGTVLYNEANGLGSTLISYVFQDKEGNHWFLPEGKGVQKLVSNPVELFDHPFDKSFINDLYTSTIADSVWLYDGLSGELVLSTGNTKKVFPLPGPPLNKAHLLVKGSLVWLYNDKKIFKMSIPVTGSRPSSILLYTDSSLQVGNGIIDPDGNIIYCADDQLKVFLKDKTVFSYRLDYYVDQPAMDQTGHLWIATRSNKLQVFTLHPEDPAHYLQLQFDLSSQMHLQNPRSLAVDDSQRIWIGTRYNGLYCFSFLQSRLTLLLHLTRKQGLTDNFINYLNCGHQHDIWASSPSGLDKLETNSAPPVIENITGSRHLYQSIKKVMTDQNNTTWALGESGNLLKVYPPANTHSTFIPLLYIMQLRSGETLFTNVDSIHDFSYRQNNLMFSVAAPSFYDEKQIKYSYLLTGSGNDQWSVPSGNADLNFVNLAPGQYTLHIRADFPVGGYPSQLCSYSFVINPPWWQTWWFRSFLGLFMLVLIVFIVRSYYQRKLREQRSALEKQQAVEKERSRIASDMHDDLGAGLSTIRFLSEKVKRNTFSDVTKNDAEKIVNNSNDLVQKMNEIIWAMNEKNDTLEDLLFYTRSYAVEYCEENNLTCETHLPEATPLISVSGEIRRNVFLTVKESLHNIVKHANAKKVIIEFKVNAALLVTIKDDGKGLTGNEKDNGNGLRNMQKRIESVKGIFELINTNGLLVKIKVPMQL